MKAVILAAAPAEKLKPFTQTRAKPMIRLAGRTIMETTVQALKEAGITDILMVVNHKRESIEQQFGHGHAHGLSIDYVEQKNGGGIGQALMQCRQQLAGEPFMLVYGDVLATGNPYQRVLDQHAETGGYVAAITLPPASAEYGNVYLDQEMRITKLVEKPTSKSLSNYVFAGIFLLGPQVFAALEENGNNMEQAFQKLIGDKRLYGSLWDGGWIDISHPWDILAANKLLMDRWDQAQVHQSVRMEGYVHIQGAVYIEEGVVIGSGSVIKGPCFIGRNSFIGNNTLIREYTSLGPNSVVGYGTELKNCVLFGSSTLGRLSFIGDSVIGEGVHLGTGCTTVNYHADGRQVVMEDEAGQPLPTGLNKLGAFIGDQCNIGARHVFRPGSRIKAGHFVDDLITLQSIF